MRLTEHFALDEFASPRYLHATGFARAADKESPPLKYHANLQRLCKALEVVRAEVGAPLHVVSGWRSREFNRRNKGRASRSQHLYGRAADLQVIGPGAEPTKQRRLFYTLQALQRAGKIPRGGLAYYPGRLDKRTGEIVGCFVHYDTRGRNARWLPAP